MATVVMPKHEDLKVVHKTVADFEVNLHSDVMLRVHLVLILMWV